MPNVKINSNVIVAAGAIITKDVPSGVIVAGCPAKAIGSFDELVKKRLNESGNIVEKDRLKRVETEWIFFNVQRS